MSLSASEVALLITAVSSPLSTIVCSYLAVREKRGHKDRQDIKRSLDTIEEATNGKISV